MKNEKITDQMRETENHCRRISIIAPPFLGKGIKAGRKMPVKNIYLWGLIK